MGLIQKDIDLKFGGTDGEIDLSSLKVEEFTLQQKLILMPGLPIFKNSGIKVEVDGLLSSVSFKDLTLEQTKKKKNLGFWRFFGTLVLL